MKKYAIFVLIFFMIFAAPLTSSCIGLEEVPIIKVESEVTVTDGKTVIEIIEVKQEMVHPLKNPKGGSDNFPSVDAKAIVNDGKGGTSYWATEGYHGNGTYEFIIGFEGDRGPKQGDIVKVIVRVINTDGKALASATWIMLWK